MHPGGIRGDIIRFRKNATGKCEEIVPVNFNSLHPDDGVKITLATEPTKGDAITEIKEATMLKKFDVCYSNLLWKIISIAQYAIWPRAGGSFVWPSLS